MEIQVLYQFFLILFGSFFAIQLKFNTKLFAQKSLRIFSKTSSKFSKAIRIFIPYGGFNVSCNNSNALNWRVWICKRINCCNWNL